MTRLLLLTLPWLAGLALFVAVQPERDSLAGLQPFPSRLRAEIHDIRDKAAEVRELPVHQGIEEGFITESALTSLFSEAIAELGSDFQESLKSRTQALRLMHLIGPNDDLESIVSGSQGTTGLAGIYFPAKKSLLSVGKLDSIGIFEEYVLAHEYIHSFQDQAFDLTSVLVPGNTPLTEASVLGQCIAEGDATAGAQAYMEEMHGDNWERKLVVEALAAQARATPGPGSSNASTASLDAAGIARYVLFVYTDCAKFVTTIRDRYGWEGVNKLYSKPPTSTEQVLHIDKFISQEMPLASPASGLESALGGAWRQDSSESFGELDLLAYVFGLSLNDASARIAADGWAGGTLTLYTNEETSAGDVLVHLTLLWDSPNELVQFRTEYQRVLARLGGTTRQLQVNSPVWEWQINSRDLGFAQWDLQSARTDVILTTSQSAMDAAQRALRSLNVHIASGSCTTAIPSQGDRIEVRTSVTDTLGLVTPLTLVARYALESQESARVVLFHSASSSEGASAQGIPIARGTGEVTISAIAPSPAALGEYFLQVLPTLSQSSESCGPLVVLASTRLNAYQFPQR